MWIDGLGGLLTLSRPGVYLLVDTLYSRTGIPLELRLKATTPERRDIYAMQSVRVVHGSALLTI
jgi:hypothetical protein